MFVSKVHCFTCIFFYLNKHSSLHKHATVNNITYNITTILLVTIPCYSYTMLTAYSVIDASCLDSDQIKDALDLWSIHNHCLLTIS